MKKGLTEIVFILDRSGSMCDVVADTIGGFNSMIEKQKKEPGEAYVSLVLFDHESEVLYDRVPIAEVPPLTEKEYIVRGNTALVDAMVGSIRHIGNVHKYARDEDRPEKTIFIVTTDGCENSSRRYTAEKLKEMVERQKAKYGWEFVFLGANIDAVETARNYGIDERRTMNFKNDRSGVKAIYEAEEMLLCKFRQNQDDESWKASIERDNQRRK